MSFNKPVRFFEWSNVAVGNRLGTSTAECLFVCACVCVCVCVCLHENETVSARVMATQPISLNQPEQPVSRVDAGHVVQTLACRQTHTHTHSHTYSRADIGPTAAL